MKYYKQAYNYLKYLINAKSRHGTHSPFVYKLLDECIYNKERRSEYGLIEDIRKQLLISNECIEITDFGAGSKIDNSKKRKIKDIAKYSAKKAKYGRLLFNICAYFNPKNGLELGTSLGISTLYQALGAKEMVLYTLEGCPNTAKIAQANFEKANISSIKLITGSFEQTLTPLLEQLDSLDYVFFDGNHKKEPTLRYFHSCLQKKHNDSVFIFDDIHWSEEMEEAWEEIKNHPEVTVTLDLFMVGIVFFRKEQPKEHFSIRY